MIKISQDDINKKYGSRRHLSPKRESIVKIEKDLDDELLEPEMINIPQV